MKLGGKSSMKQYVKTKPIKWGFNSWFHCGRYLYELHMYLGLNEPTEYNLGESVVLNLATHLNDSYCTLLLGNFFCSANLIQTLFKKTFTTLELSGKLGTTCQHFCQTKLLKEVYVKWMDNRAVTLIWSNVGVLNQMSSVVRCQRGASSKSSMFCPIIVKKYIQSMGGVDLLQSYTVAYHLHQQSKFCFYLYIIFDLMDVAQVSRFIVYDKLHPNALGPFTTLTRYFPSSRPTKGQLTQVVTNESQFHFREYQQTRRRCA